MRVTVVTVQASRSASKTRTTVIENEDDWLALYQSVERVDHDPDVLSVQLHIEGES